MVAKLIFDKLPKQITTPPVIHETEQFVLKLAENDQEVEKTLRLRYEVFNLERGKGLKSSDLSGIDRDEFDDYCLHLTVFDKKSGDALGTYRIHFGDIAYKAMGFYSSREYKIEGLDKIVNNCIEVGRTCVTPEFRTGSAVALLWSGIKKLLIRSKARFLLGCVSLESTNPLDGWGLYEYLKMKDLISDLLTAVPQKEFILEKPANYDVSKMDLEQYGKKLPPLFKGYLRMGSKICGEPALDNEFGTIDYLILLDTKFLAERYARHFT